MKTCSRCGAEYANPADGFYRRSGGKYWSSHCKTCISKHKKQRYRDDPEKHRKQARDSYHRHSEKRRAGMRERNKDPEFRKYKRKYNQAYREEHHERLLEKDRKYSREHREAKAAYMREWLEKNPGYYREYDRSRRPEPTPEQVARFKEYQSRWAKENRDKKNAAKHRRRAKKRNAAGDHTPEDVARQKERQRHRCYWCGKKIRGAHHADHVVPLSRGGTNGPENIVVACPTCNLSKGAKLPSEHAGMLDLWPRCA